MKRRITIQSFYSSLRPKTGVRRHFSSPTISYEITPGSNFGLEQKSWCVDFFHKDCFHKISSSSELPDVSPEVTPEAFLERFWGGVALAEPSYAPDDFKEAWELQKLYQRIQDGADYAHFQCEFWEDWNQELVNYADFYSNDIREEAKRNCGALDSQLEAAAALDTEEFLKAMLSKANNSFLSELQAAPISASEAELFAEISEFCQETLDSEMLADFENLMPSYINIPERAKPFKSIVLESYIPKRPVFARGYSIEYSGGDPGGDPGWGNGGGGSNWNGGDSGWDDWDDWDDGDGGKNGPDYFALFLFGSFCMAIARVLYLYGYKLVGFSSEKLQAIWCRVTKQKLNQASAGLEPQKRALLAALIPVIFAGSALAVLSYVFNPERLREIVALLADAIVILAHELGRVLLQLIPPQLHELAQRVGEAIEVLGAYVRQIVEDVVIPVLLYARTATIWFLSVFLSLKLVKLGVELYQMLAASGFFQQVPPQVTAKAAEVADLIGAITEADSPALFLNQFLKASSLLVLGLMPVPKFGKPKSLVRFGHLVAIFCVYGFVLQDTRYISKLAGWALQASPELVSMMSCIAGRWCLIVITANFARQEKALKAYSLTFYCLLYVLRVYQLAFSASSNFLP